MLKVINKVGLMQHKSGRGSGLVSVRTFVLLALLAACSGCTIMTGMRNEIDRGTVPVPDLDIVEVTPEVVLGEALLQSASVMKDDLSALQSPPDLRGYRLGPGDVVRVVVWEHPELNNPSGQAQGDAASSGRLIEPDGTVFFPYVGKIKAEGMTPADLREQIGSALTKIIREPQVDVRVTEFRSQRVYITGEVAAPGPLFLNDSPIGALDAIASKGGFTEFSNRTRILLTRNGVTSTLGLGDSIHADPRTSIYLKGGDLLHIPDT
ncbi:MAG: polysaccharide biosynthesis/export family protein, partial [Proteobacteria bacterium]|nr:polysaccharide biosynthesis/export family protein [Pseudomonadota bacterium]